MASLACDAALIGALAVAAAAAAALAASHAQQPVGLVPLDPPPPPIIVDGIEVLPVQGQVYMLAGAGGNVTLQVGRRRRPAWWTRARRARATKLLAAIARLTTRPVRFLVNTNADPDHVAGNGAIVQAQGGIRGPRPRQRGRRQPARARTPA